NQGIRFLWHGCVCLYGWFSHFALSSFLFVLFFLNLDGKKITFLYPNMQGEIEYKAMYKQQSKTKDYCFFSLILVNIMGILKCILLIFYYYTTYFNFYNHC